MYCRDCGNQMGDGQAFCDKCGARADGPGGGQAPPHMIYTPEKSAGVAAVLSFLWAGAGQIYAGKIARGLLLLLGYMLLMATGVGITFMGAALGGLGGALVGGVLLLVFTLSVWVWNIFDAYKLANEYNDYLRAHGTRPW